MKETTITTATCDNTKKLQRDYSPRFWKIYWVCIFSIVIIYGVSLLLLTNSSLD